MRIRFAVAVGAALAIPILFSACSSNQEGSTDGAVYIQSTVDGSNCPYWNIDPNQSPYVRPTIKAQKFVSKVKKTGASSSFMDVKLTDCWVEYTRIDGGTIVPRQYHFPWTIIVPVGGTGTLNNGPILSDDQMLESPFDNLAQRGYDPETGNQTIKMKAKVTWYGKTMSGESIVTSFVLDEEFKYGGGCTNGS